MRDLLFILLASFLFSQPAYDDWELPISLSDYGWYPTNYECVDDNGNNCPNAANEWSCENQGCTWRNTECGGSYGGELIGTTCHGLSDTIYIGLSDSAQVGFRYGEDQINLTPTEHMAPFIDGYFYHPDWWGSFWVNSIGDTIYCEWLQFDSDIRTYPDSINIMEWEIHALIMEMPIWMNYRLTWPNIQLPEEFDISERLRQSGQKVFVVVNKVEDLDPDVITAEFNELGLGAPRAISAKTGFGVAELLAWLG